MALVLEANYAKKLGLPGYSSHQYSVSIRTELTDLAQAAEESDRLYRLLQDAVDTAIQHPGFLPEAELVTTPVKTIASAPNGRAVPRNGNGSTAWHCSDKQRDLIEKIVAERGLDKTEVERLAQERFGAGVRQLNRLQMSGLLDELLEPPANSGPPATRRANGSGYPRRTRA